MDLTIYDVIKGPRVTEKAYRLNQMFKQLVLEVHPQANAILVAEALQKLFNVKVEKINIIVCKGKKRRSGRFFTTGIDKKKAIVVLKKGYSIDLMGISNTTDATESQAVVESE